MLTFLYCNAESEKLFNDAMKEGKMTVNITNTLIQGEAGVGKTSTRHILFNEPPPKVRTSTPLAEPPVQTRVNKPTSQSAAKNISDVKARSLGGSWQAFSDSQLQEIVTDVIAATHQLNERAPFKISCANEISELGISDEFMQIAKKSVRKERENFSSSSSQTENPNSPKSVEIHSCDNSSNITICEDRSENDQFEEIAQRSVHGKTTADKRNSHILSEEMPNKTSHYEHSGRVAPCSSDFQIAFANIRSKIVYLTDKKKSQSFEAASDIFGTDWIYFIDSGGQPHFHNLLPHFVHGISVALFVHRLSRKLDDYPIVEYFEKDQSLAAPYESPLTTEDTLKCLVRSMQSHTVDGKKPKLVFIGTFLDEIRKSMETLPEKNEKLLTLLTTDFVDQLVFCTKDLRVPELIFPLNAKNPDDNEQRVCTKIRLAVESSHSRKVDMPIWWFVLEIILKELSNKLGRKVFSKRECLEVAYWLGISDDALDVALQFFHYQHIFHYYPGILPNVVFSSPQVLLDKLTELVKDAYFMRGNSSSSSEQALDPVSGSWMKVRNQGIVTLEFLSSFKQHYQFEDNLFTPPDLLKIFMKHFILTPLSTDELHHVVDFTSPLIKYYMPSLLDVLPPSKLENHRTFSSSAFPLLIQFPNGWPRAGVFCCLQVYLIQQKKWRLVLKNRKPKLITQNCVMLFPPESTCIVTLIDAFSYFEIHVQAEPRVCQEDCPKIKDDILSGIHASCKILRYHNDQPHLSFFCLCSLSCTNPYSSGSSLSLKQRHAAELLLKKGSLRCTIDETITNRIEDRHTIWLPECEWIRLFLYAHQVFLYIGEIFTKTKAAPDPAIDALLQKYGLTNDDVDQECSNEHILEISKNLVKWKLLSLHLRLNQADIETVENNAAHDIELMRLQALMKWKSVSVTRNFAATYRVLLKALLKCECSEKAQQLCELLKSNH